MNPQTYLSALTFTGLGVGLIGGLISQLTKTSVELDGMTRKRLTSAGKWALAISLIGFAGSFSSELFKSSIQAQQQAHAELEARLEQERRRQDDLWKDRSNNLAEAIFNKTTSALQTSEANLTATIKGFENAQQRDLSNAQQQLAGFNKAEVLARKRTLAELSDIRRGQYPIGREVELSGSVTLSGNHPILQEGARQVQNKVKQLVQIAEQRLREVPKEQRNNVVLPSPLIIDSSTLEIDDSILITDRNSPFLPNQNTQSTWTLTEMPLHISIFREGREVDPKSLPDISLTYTLRPFREVKRRNSDGTYSGSMGYFWKTGAYGIAGGPATVDIISNGKIISYLDLPGSTLVVNCPTHEFGAARSRCEYTDIESLTLVTETGIYMKIEGRLFEHRLMDGQNFLVHKFVGGADNFLDTYRLK